MVANFKLTKRLRLFVQVAGRYRVFTLGDRFPVSIRRRTKLSQSIVIFPDSDYHFFTGREILCSLTLAQGLELDSIVSVVNGVPVIEITDYNLNEK